MKNLITLLLLFVTISLSSQNHPAFNYLHWGDSFKRVQSKVNGDYLVRGYSVVPGSKSKHSKNLSVFPDPQYSTATYPMYALLFIDNKLVGITETIDPEMSRYVLGTYSLKDVDLFYKQDGMEVYVWKFPDDNTSITLEYNPKTGFLRSSWIKNKVTKI